MARQGRRENTCQRALPKQGTGLPTAPTRKAHAEKAKTITPEHSATSPGPRREPPPRGDRKAPSGSPRGAALRRDVRRGRSTRRPRPGASPSAPGRGPSRASRPSLTLANVVRVPPGPPGASRGFFASLDVSPFLSFGVAEKTAAASALLLPSFLSLFPSFFSSFLCLFCAASSSQIVQPKQAGFLFPP